MELANPEKVRWEFADAPLGVGGREFLFVIEESGSKTTFGVIMHLAGANLKFNNLFIASNYGSVE